MKLNLDVVPKNLDDAVRILKEAIQDVKEAKDLQSTDGLHFGLGMYLRNNWSLWDRETVLVQWFKENLGIAHADDLSGTILEALAASLRGDKFDVEVHVRKYIKYWNGLGINPLKDV